MRRAFELGFATAYSFAGSAPCFVEVDHVDFLKHVSSCSSINFLLVKICLCFTLLVFSCQNYLDQISKYNRV